MTTSYGHFCLAARTLDTVGDRWSLLIVRDLLGGPRRFGDLRRLLTTVTPKWLTIRLRRLEAEGIVTRHQERGRRGVWYELTEKGRELAPVLEALVAWGLKHERHPLGPDEAAHPEHLMSGLVVALNDFAPRPSGPSAWRFAFDGVQAFDLLFDGERWALGDTDRTPEVVVSTTARAWAEFVTRPLEQRRLPTSDIRLSGTSERVAELTKIFGAAPATVVAAAS
jgi:DNA-binding HxlR family transcriptional regulator